MELPMELPMLSGPQILAALQRLGFREIHRKGSHVKMKSPDGRIIVFPLHDEVDRRTWKGALRDADIDFQIFIDQIK
jgi:predicted RNA binding protein YcfA (HicA-like mRNA interferase family)